MVRLSAPEVCRSDGRVHRRRGIPFQLVELYVQASDKSGPWSRDCLLIPYCDSWSLKRSTAAMTLAHEDALHLGPQRPNL